MKVPYQKPLSRFLSDAQAYPLRSHEGCEWSHRHIPKTCTSLQLAIKFCKPCTAPMSEPKVSCRFYTQVPKPFLFSSRHLYELYCCSFPVFESTAMSGYFLEYVPRNINIKEIKYLINMHYSLPLTRVSWCSHESKHSKPSPCRVWKCNSGILKTLN